MYIFVYGTLKSGEPNHYILQNRENGVQTFVSKGKTLQQFPLIVATKYEIPFLLDKVGIGKNISGEVYKIDDKMLSTLDKLEGYPEVYSRRPEDVELFLDMERNNVKAWVYVLPKFKPSFLHQNVLIDSYTCKNVDKLPKCLTNEEKTEILETVCLK